MKKFMLWALMCLFAVTAWADGPFRNHRYDSFKTLPQAGSEDIVFIGNSITNMMNWWEALGSNQKIKGRGNSGAVTQEVLDNLESMIAGQPAKVFLMIGTNDLGTAGIDDPNYVARQIETIITRIRKESPATMVYCQSILPSGLRDAAKIRKTNELVSAWITSQADAKVTYVNLYPLLDDGNGQIASTSNNGTAANSYDNLHLTALGYQKWLKAIEPYLPEDCRCQIPEGIQTLGSGLGGSAGMRSTYFGALPVKSSDILMIGDEMIHGFEWHEVLGADFKDRGIGWGYPGVNIANMTAELNAIFGGNEGKVTKQTPKAVCLYAGVADCNDENYNEANVKAAYKALVDGIRAKVSATTPIFLMTLAPHPTAANNERAKTLNAYMQSLASADVNLHLIDLYSVATSGGARQETYFMGTSNAYISGLGYIAFANAIKTSVNSTLGTSYSCITMEQAQSNLARFNSRKAIGDATNLYATIDNYAGTGIGQYPETAVNTYKSAIEPAFTALQSLNPTTGTDFAAAKATLQQSLNPVNEAAVSGKQFAISTPNRATLYAYTDGATLNSTSSNPGYKKYRWIFESRGDGTFNIKNADKNVYMSPTAAHNTQIQMTATAPATGWTMDYSDALGLYIIKNGTTCELNSTDKAGNPIYNWHNTSNATNRSDTGCQWLIEDVTDVPVVPNPDPINVVKGTAQEGAATLVDGHIYTITNHQQDGTCYPLYVTDGLKVGEANALAAKSYGNRAQFRAIAKAGGKWAFQSVLTDQYLVWIGGSGGYNSNKGVTDEYNATYCDMTITSVSNITNGKLITGKRANNNAGTFIQNANGTWNAWGAASVGVTATYSNLYTFGDVTDGNDGEVADLPDGTTSVTIAYNTGSFAGSGNYRNTWKSTSTEPQITVNAKASEELVNNMYPLASAADAFINYTGNRNLSNGNYSSNIVVSVSNGYEIIGYSFDAVLYEANTNVSLTTPKGSMTLTTTKKSESHTFAEPVTSFGFTQTGANKAAKFTNFRVLVQEKVGARTYTIKSSRGDFFATAESELLLNSCGRNNTTLINKQNAQWVLIPGSVEGTFYFYNVFTDKFIGAPSTSDASKLTMSTNPTTTYYRWASNSKQGFPWTIGDGANASSNMLNVTDWNNNGVGYIFGKSTLDDGNEYAIEPVGSISQDEYDALLQRIDEYKGRAIAGKVYTIKARFADGKSFYVYDNGTTAAASQTVPEDLSGYWMYTADGKFKNFKTPTRLLAANSGQNGLSVNTTGAAFTLADGLAEGTLTLMDGSYSYCVKYDGTVAGGRYSDKRKCNTAGASNWTTDFVLEEYDPSSAFMSESLADAKWLRLTNANNTSYVWTNKGATANGGTAQADASSADQLFAFVGTLTDGFYIYNKVLGASYTLTSANTTNGTAATWQQNAAQPTKWYLVDTYLNAAEKPGYVITTNKASNQGVNMYGGAGGDLKYWAASDGGTHWTISAVDNNPTIIHYTITGTKKYSDANQWVGKLKIQKGNFTSETLIGEDVNGTTFNAYLPKSSAEVVLSNFNLHGWSFSCEERNGEHYVTYTADQETEYQYLGFRPDAQWYRIPAIVSAKNGDIVSIYDWRVCHNDVGFGEVDQVMRRSTDFGQTWSAEKVIADGNGGGKVFGAAFGDPALVADRESSKMTLITVSGTTAYPNATATDHNLVSVQFSEDNGMTWSEPQNITSQFWGAASGMLADADTEAASTTFAYSGFFGSGKILQSRVTKVGDYYRIYAAMLCRGKNVKGAYVVYSDDMGHTWQLLGGNNTIKAAEGSDEPKVEELPNGDIVLSCRKYNGRYFNIWKWNTLPTKENKLGAGQWGSVVDSNTIGTGIKVGGNSCNGEILFVKCKKADDSDAILMLQSLPSGNDRSGVEIWYKDVTDASSYSNVTTFASNWTRGLRVSPQSPESFSAYSTMTVQQDGRIGFLYEEGPATYCMVYVPLTVEKITNNAYKGIEVSLPTAEYIEAVGGMKSAYSEKAGVELGEGWLDYVASDPAAMQQAMEAAEPYMEQSAIELYNAPVSIKTLQGITAALQAVNIVQKCKKGCFVRLKGYSNNYVSLPTTGTNGKMSSATDNSTILYLSPEGEFISYGTGYGLTSTSIANTTGLSKFTVMSSGRADKYYIKSDATGVGTYLYDNTASGTKVDRNGSPVTSGSYQTDWSIEEVTALPVGLSTIGSHSYATLYSPVAITMPEGVKAYVAEQDGTKAVMQEVSVIPANTGVVLYSKEAATDAELTVGGQANGETSILSGTVVTKASFEGICTMQSINNSLGFYNFTGTTLKGFKAYLDTNTSEVKSFTFDFDMETAIRGIQEAEEKSAAMYDMSGRRILKAQKGVYILNGKKFVK
ncbi:MAG: exo-alpha-sialidase [Bacteroidales bacterium]|nr:exo-alpha-sialidase [Bacteroidales bacterium]